MECFVFISFVIFALTQAKRDCPKIIPLRSNAMKSRYLNETVSRIAGGEEAYPHRYPYQAALFILNDEYDEILPKMFDKFCGGAIISENFILTSAVCLDRAVSVEVVLGAHNIFEDEETQESHRSEKFIIHPGWHPEAFRSVDLALIKLPTSITFSDQIQPIRLPKYSDVDKVLTKTPVVISGWGRDSDRVCAIRPALRFVNTEIISLRLCKLFFWGRPGVKEICTKGRGGKGVCIGDAGGPMVTEDENGETILQGIVSYDYVLPSCEPGSPSVFARVGAFLDWIHKHTHIEIDD